jgi:hypothetical protein
MFSALFAHLAYDYHLYYLAGIGVALQSAYARYLKRTGGAVEAKPKRNGRLAVATRSAAL